MTPDQPAPFPAPSDDAAAAASTGDLTKSNSATSLPNLHPLTTIPENSRTNTTLSSQYASHSRRAVTWRAAPYPDTPSYTQSTPQTPFPFTTTARSRASSGATNPAFFVWPLGSKNPKKDRVPTGLLPPPATAAIATADYAVDPTATTAANGAKTLPSPAASEVTTREWEHEARLIAKRRKAEFPRRFLTALFGGVAIVVPMVIMALHPDLTKSLVTSSVAVTVFALTLAATSTADEASLLVATAGYAAVLAVFVAVGDGEHGA